MGQLVIEKGQKRGQLTDRVQAKSNELLGYVISKEELRLLPYIQYVLVNEQYIDPVKINDEERQILLKWRKAGYIKDVNVFNVSKDFWDIINELIFLGYVDLF